MSEVLAQLEKKGGKGELDYLLEGYTNLATDTLTGLTVTRYGTVINDDGFDVTGGGNGVKVTRSDSRNYCLLFVWDDDITSQVGACQTNATLPSVINTGTNRVYFSSSRRIAEIPFTDYARFMGLSSAMTGTRKLKVYGRVLS